MDVRLIALLMVVSAGTHAAESRGFCPPTPPKPKVVATKPSVPQNPPSPDAQYAGTVTLMAVISDKGYVCDAQVIRGFDKETDKKAASSVRQWHFEPARKDGHAVPVVITLEVNFWRKDGELNNPLSLSPWTSRYSKSAARAQHRRLALLRPPSSRPNRLSLARAARWTDGDAALVLPHPGQGEPVKLVHKIEAGHLDTLPGKKRQYADGRNCSTAPKPSSPRIATLPWSTR